jgi:hypothetical protein
MRLGHLARTQIELLLGEDHDRAALRGFIGQGSQLGGIRQPLRLDAWSRDELRGHSVSKRDRAGLVQQ